MAFSNTPICGAALTTRSSSATHALLTPTTGSDGRKYVYVRASEALASTSAVNIRSLGSASSMTTGSGATYDLGPTGNGGALSGAYFWARKTSL